MSEGGMESAKEQAGSTGMVFAVYILYLVGILVSLTHFIAVILAYVCRGAAKDWLKSHYAFQIRTFWIGLLAVAIAFLLPFLAAGAHELSLALSDITVIDFPLYFLWFVALDILFVMADGRQFFLIVILAIYVSFVLWLIVRCAKGMSSLAKGKAHPNPKSWLFG